MKVFFRNDDVNTLDRELIGLVDIFLAADIPITMAVEPANVTEDTVSYFQEIKKQSPDKICIVQHGYDHQDRIPGKGEFGGRTYVDQFHDIKKGKILLEEYFDSIFFPAFSCPRHFHNKSTVKCLDDLSFKVFSSGHGLTYPHKIFYAIGRMLKVSVLFDKHISYHGNVIPGTKLWEFSMSMSPISSYHSMHSCEFASLSDLIKKHLACEKSMDVLGITLHHRYHIDNEKIDLIANLLQYLKEKQCDFFSLESLYEEYTL